MTLSRFSFPTLIHFGPGVRSKVPAFIMGKGFQRPLVITDKGLAALPAFARLMSDLRDGGLEAAAFSGVWGNPVKSQVSAGVDAFRAHHADSMIGFGGGAALDVAKAIALMAHHPGDLFDYEDDKPGGLPVNKEVPFWVAVPTTSGTGSEVGRSAVISDDQSHVKKIIFDPALLAKAVFADPELTYALPPAVTAATGMDALTHCVEAYLAKGFHPLCDGIALEGLRLAGSSLARCVSTPGDVEARGSMMMASLMGAVAFQKGLGIVHSCAHALSAYKDLHHGLANGIMLDHALAFNVPTVPERFRVLARTLELKDESAQGFLAWLRELKAATGIPAKLSGCGAADVKALAALALADACHPSNPRPCTLQDFEAVFSSAV